jgi:hypothetical protein
MNSAVAALSSRVDAVLLPDSVAGALPITRISGDTITRLEVLTLRTNLADSTIGSLAADSVAAARSQLSVDSPTLVVDASNNRVGIDSNAPAAALSVGGQILALDTVTARAFVGSGIGLTGVAASTVNAQNINGPINLADSTTASLPIARLSGAVSLADSTVGTLLGDSVAAARSNLNVDSPTFVIDAANNHVGIGSSSPNFPLEVIGNPTPVWDTVRIFNANLLIDSGFLVLRTNSFFDGAWNTYPYPSASIDDAIILYTSDTGFGAELKVRDENGNVWCLSPHNFELAPRTEEMSWSTYSENHRVGWKMNIDMLRMVRLVERLSGQKLVYMSAFGDNPVVDVEALDRYVENGGATIPETIERLEAQNAELKRSLQLLLDRLEALERR